LRHSVFTSWRSRTSLRLLASDLTREAQRRKEYYYFLESGSKNHKSHETKKEKRNPWQAPHIRMNRQAGASPRSYRSAQMPAPFPPANWFVDHWQQRHARGSTTHKNVMTAHKQVDLVKKIKAIVSGNIQNVGYRAKVIAFARAFELAGFVQNLDDGRVKIIAEGEEDTYPLQIKW